MQEGGHNIPTDVIIRRYKRGICNLFDIYMPIVDEYMIIDNSDGKRELIAKKSKSKELMLDNKRKFNEIEGQADEYRTN